MTTLSNPPSVSADAANPTRDVDVSAGNAGSAGAIRMQLAAVMAKRLDQAWVAGGAVGASQGACDVGSKGAGQTWNIFLIGAPLWPPALFTGGPGTPRDLSRVSGVATMTIPAHPLGVGGTLLIGGTNGSILGFEGAYAITAVTDDTVSFASPGPDVAAVNLLSLKWGYPVVAGFDVIASQEVQPALPQPFTLKAPLASVTTDASGNIATITPASTDGR